ncbi:F-box protein-like protein isoform X2 [Tanacetum coccineum]
METIASIKGTEDNELPLLVHKVVSSEDLLIEILVRLPIISLHLFRFVSKWWLSLITSPRFMMRRSQIPNLDPTSGFFLRGNRSSNENDFLSLDIRIPPNSYRLNPPALEDPDDDIGGSKITFDPTKSPYYKVILHYKLEVEHQAKTNIHTHVTLDDTVDHNYLNFWLFESRGCLLFVTTRFDTPVLKMDVYEMSNDDSRWLVKYFVTLDEGWRSTPTKVVFGNT